MAGERPMPADENLPEVVPDSSPEVLSGRDAYLAHEHLAEKDPKYIADSSPRPGERDLKFAVDGQEGAKGEEGVWQDGVWRPATASPISPAGEGVSPDVDEDPHAAEEARGGEGGGAGKGADKVCGMRKRTFWIVLVAAIVIVVAAIGGGVGGGLSAKKPKSESTSEPSPPEGNFLNNGTIPDRGNAFQAFSEANYSGASTEIITTEGYHDLPFPAKSYVWVPNGSGCCLAFCQDLRNSTSFWCDPRFREETPEPFPRFGLLCGVAFNYEGKEQRCVEKGSEEE